MNGQKKLVCVEAGLGITEGKEFPVLGENGSVWEIVLGGEYRKVNKRSGRVQGWKTGPRFVDWPLEDPDTSPLLT